MIEWKLTKTDKFVRDFEYYQKKHPNELVAVMDNVDTYFRTLKKLGNPLQIQAGFIHREPAGIKAIDQKGGKQKVKLQQTRLYVYPDIDRSTLFLFAIGNKTNQSEDIRYCQEMVKKLKSGRES